MNQDWRMDVNFRHNRLKKNNPNWISDHLCVFCPRMGMGDLISFVAHFKTIHKKTGKKLIIVTKETTAGKQYLLNEPYCSEIIYLPNRKRGLLNFYSNLKDFYFLTNLIKNTNAKEIFVLHSSKRYVLASIFSGCKKIYAPGLGIQNFFLKKEHSYYQSCFEKKVHPRLESELLVKKIFNLKGFENNFLLDIKGKRNQSHILIGLACSGNSKQWGYENHHKIIGYLIKKNYKNFYLLAGKKQADIEKKLISDFNSKDISIRGTSHLDLKNILEMINEGIFYFGHDTGFMHLTSSLNIPTIAVFGDIPPYNYSDNMSSIGPDDNIFTDSSIKKILFEKVKDALDKFLNKHDL